MEGGSVLQVCGTNSSSSNVGVTDVTAGPASVMVGNLVQGNRLAAAQGRDIGLGDDNERKVIHLKGIHYQYVILNFPYLF